MRRLLLGLVLTVCLASTALSQLTATLTIKNFTQGGGNYSFEIWAKRTNVTGNIFVGISSFYFTYNAAGLGAPSLSSINAKYTGDGTGATNYGPMTVGLTGGKLAVTVNYTGLAGGSSTLSTADPDGEQICTVTLPVTNPAQTAQVAWDQANSAISTSNSQPVGHTFIGADDSPLPVQLASLKAVAVAAGTVTLTWSTASETDNYGFYVQKSNGDMQNYRTIENSFVAGHGTTVEPHTYAYTDAGATAGDWYYRLEQVDRDGTRHYSDGVRPSGVTGVAERPVPTAYAMDQNYPNPFNPSTVIEFALPRETRVTLEVYNLLGQRVALLVDDVRPAGYYAQRFDGSSFGSGLYFYRLSAGEVSFLKKMLLVK